MSSRDHRPGGRPGRWSERATLEDVYHAYRLILRRPPDPDGFAHYESLVAGGLSLEDLTRGFADSDEARADTQPTQIDLGGYRVCVQRRDIEFARTIIATHDYEPHVRRAIRERLCAGDVVVDIGANVGCIALMAAALAGERGLVVAVEPNPDNLRAASSTCNSASRRRCSTGSSRSIQASGPPARSGTTNGSRGRPIFSIACAAGIAR